MAGPGQAVRGGVPVIFPQFEQLGPDTSLPRHGLARTRAWRVDSHHQGRDHTQLTLVLSDDADTRAALAECRRVLRPGGACVFTMPFFPLRATTLVDAGVEHPAGERMQPSVHAPKCSPVRLVRPERRLVARTGGEREHVVAGGDEPIGHRQAARQPVQGDQVSGQRG